MSKIYIPDGYRPLLSMYDTQKAIGVIKRQFADTLAATLQLHRVSAPLFLEASTGLNDDLNGYERKVTFGRDWHSKTITSMSGRAFIRI